MNDKLLPCPFCGGEAQLVCVGEPDWKTGEPLAVRPECINCLCTLDEQWDNRERDKAIAAWNNRRMTRYKDRT